MKEKLKQIHQAALESLAEVKEAKALDEMKVSLLGKKGELTGILKGMKDLSPEERPVIGELANQVRKDIEEKIEEIMQQEKPNQKEFIKIHHERIEKYILTKIKESGKVEDFIIQCVEEHNKREKLRQERNAR